MNRRTRGGLATIGVLILAGCAPPPTSVRIDVEAGYSNPPAWVAARPSVPRVDSALSAGWPASPSRNLFLGDNASALREAADRISDSRERAFAQILRRLRLALDRDMEQLERDRLATLDEAARVRLDAVVDELAARFGLQAAETGRLLVALSNLVGWPDLDPESRRPLPHPRLDIPASEVAARSLRAELAIRDAEFYALAQRRLSEAQAVNTRDREALTQELAAERGRRDAEAQRLARLKVPVSREAGATRRLNQPLAGLPAATITSTQIGPIAVPLVVPLGSDESFARQRRNLAARIYAAVHGKRVAEPNRAAPNETREFKAWLTTLAGP